MKFLTLEQLQQAHAAGELGTVTLQADGAEFEIRIAVKAGLHQLAGHFADAGEALRLLQGIGISEVQVVGDDAASRAIRKALAGLKDGTNAVYAPDEWELVRASKRMQRDAL